MGMELQTIHHAGLIVSDLDRSIYFYHDILGLPFANEPTPWFEGPALAKGVGVPDAKLRQVCFWVGDKSQMELIEYDPQLDYNGGPVPNNHRGAAHVCFRVEDIAAKKAELEGKGVVFYSDINVVDEGPLSGWRWCYFSDPDGLALELVEIAYYNKEDRDAASAEYLASRPSLDEIRSRSEFSFTVS
jgi:glyoxylase I family protein